MSNKQTTAVIIILSLIIVGLLFYFWVYPTLYTQAYNQGQSDLAQAQFIQKGFAWSNGTEVQSFGVCSAEVLEMCGVEVRE